MGRLVTLSYGKKPVLVGPGSWGWLWWFPRWWLEKKLEARRKGIPGSSEASDRSGGHPDRCVWTVRWALTKLSHKAIVKIKYLIAHGWALRAAAHLWGVITGHKERGLCLQFSLIGCPFENGMEFHFKNLSQVIKPMYGILLKLKHWHNTFFIVLGSCDFLIDIYQAEVPCFPAQWCWSYSSVSASSGLSACGSQVHPGSGLPSCYWPAFAPS